MIRLSEFVVALMVRWRDDLNCVVYRYGVVCLVTRQVTSGEERNTPMCSDGVFFHLVSLD